MKPTIKITGTRDIERRLRKLSTTTRQKVLEQALRAGGEVITEEARMRVPERTGNLRDSIAVSTRSLNYSSVQLGEGEAEIFVGPAEGGNTPHDGFYGHMVEFGTVHSMPRPFMRPAFDAKAKDASDVVIKHLQGEFKKNTKG